jgi:hypothetical protein
VDHQVGGPADAVDLQHLGDRGQRVGHLVQPALGHLGGDVRGKRVTEGRGRDLALKRVEHAAGFQAGQPRLHGIARQAGLGAQRDRARARLADQGQEQAGVGRVDVMLPGHNAHLRSRAAHGRWAICTPDEREVVQSFP